MTEQKKKSMEIFKNSSASIQSNNFDTTTITTAAIYQTIFCAETRRFEEYVILINLPAICFLDIPIV